MRTEDALLVYIADGSGKWLVFLKGMPSISVTVSKPEEAPEKLAQAFKELIQILVDTDKQHFFDV